MFKVFNFTGKFVKIDCKTYTKQSNVANMYTDKKAVNKTLVITF